MNTAPPMDKATFLAWVQERERKRYELVDGAIVEAGLHTLGHARVVGNLAKALDAVLGQDQRHVLLSFGVETGPNTIRDPDVLVDRGGKASDLTTKAPVLVAEVRSPHSIETDLSDKPTEYMRLPSLLGYLVLSQDEPKAWTWIRGESGFSPGAEVVAGVDGLIRIPALSIELPLADIYRDVALD